MSLFLSLKQRQVQIETHLWRHFSQIKTLLCLNFSENNKKVLIVVKDKPDVSQHYSHGVSRQGQSRNYNSWIQSCFPHTCDLVVGTGANILFHRTGVLRFQVLLNFDWNVCPQNPLTNLFIWLLLLLVSACAFVLLLSLTQLVYVARRKILFKKTDHYQPLVSLQFGLKITIIACA